MESKRQEPHIDVSSRYTTEVRDLAAQYAREMIISGKKILSFSYGHESGTLFISDDPTLLIGSEVIMVDNKKIYIGIALADSI